MVVSGFMINFSLAVIISIMLPLSSYCYLSALAFHTASTANVTIQTGDIRRDIASPGQESPGFENASLLLEMAAEIEGHIDRALQALSDDDISEVENQLIVTKEKLSSVKSGQQE